MSGPASISVIVPVLNGARFLEGCLRSIQAQEYASDRFEILVVDNGSRDGSPEIAERLGVKTLFEASPGAGLARNRGIAAASGGLVAFTDADCLVPPGWLAALVRALQNADAVMGGIEPAPGGNRFARARGALHAGYIEECRRLAVEGRLDRLDTAHAAVTRRCLDEVGGFHPEIFPAEDRELGARIAERGGRVAFVDGVAVLHRYETEIMASMRKAEAAGRMFAKLPALLPTTVLDRHFPDVGRSLAAAAPFASAAGRRRLLLRFRLHVAAAALRPGFAACLRHFREAEKLAKLLGIVRTDPTQARVQTKR